MVAYTSGTDYSNVLKAILLLYFDKNWI